jgi:hypothetical protein
VSRRIYWAPKVRSSTSGYSGTFRPSSSWKPKEAYAGRYSASCEGPSRNTLDRRRPRHIGLAVTKPITPAV